ncbi:MAG: peptidase MA family metallohydrolase [Myxococcota bacterium]
MGQSPPADVIHLAGERTPELPPAPEDYVSETRDEAHWDFPASATSRVRELQTTYSDAWDRVTADLGVEVERRVTIRVGLNPEEMAALAPIGYPPPGYAAGVAYPGFGVILLTLSAPESWEPTNLDKVLVHEISHIALHRATNHEPMPRWFVEGVAVYQAEENDIARIRSLWTATVAGSLVPLGRLSRSFPDRPHRVNVAYAQSADIVTFLREQDRGTERFQEVIRDVGEGRPFSESVEDAYNESLASIEQRWLTQLNERFSSIPLLVSGTGLWFFASLLLVMAYIRRRRDKRRKLAEWEAEERAEDEALEAAQAAIDEQLADIPAMGTIRTDRDGTVPTVEYDGRNHTLH